MIRAVALVLVVFLLVLHSSSERVRFIWPQQILSAHQSSVWTIRVEPMPENRELKLVADAADGPVRVSRVPLDGEDAATIHIFRWGPLPSGDLIVYAIVYSATDEVARAEVYVQVLERF
jgi:hypothetical protein